MELVLSQWEGSGSRPSPRTQQFHLPKGTPPQNAPSMPPHNTTSQHHLTMPLHNTTSQCHLTMAPQNAISQCHFTMPPHNTTSQRHLKTPPTNTTSQRHLTMPPHNAPMNEDQCRLSTCPPATVATKRGLAGDPQLPLAQYKPLSLFLPL